MGSDESAKNDNFVPTNFQKMIQQVHVNKIVCHTNTTTIFFNLRKE